MNFLENLAKRHPPAMRQDKSVQKRIQRKKFSSVEKWFFETIFLLPMEIYNEHSRRKTFSKKLFQSRERKVPCVM